MSWKPASAALCWALLCCLTVNTGALADNPPHQVRDINRARIPESSNPGYLGILNGRVLFGATDRQGAGLWASDGTSSGTRIIKRVDVFAQRNFPGSPLFIVENGLGFFAGDDASTGVLELWVTDGTAQGTVRLTSHTTSTTSYSGFFDFIGILHGRVIFYASDADGVMQVWSSNGTPAGTVQLSPLQAGNSAGAHGPTLMLPDRFYFISSGLPLYDQQLWVSDGTAQGTRAVDSSNLQFPGDVQSLAAAGNVPILTSGNLLWAIDPGTETVVPDTFTGAQPGYPNQPPADTAVSLGGVVISLGTNDFFTSTQLWRSDGTPAGTYHLADVNLASAPNFILQPLPINMLVTFNGRALTVARDTSGNLQLLSTDGTINGTVPLLGLPAPSDSVGSDLIPFQAINNIFYFAVPNDASGETWSIWRTDGTSAGTKRTSLPAIPISVVGLTQFFGAGSRVFVVPGSETQTPTLLVYDPATDITHTIDSLAIPAYESAVASAERLYFSVNDQKVGLEPWVSDGTAQGTYRVRDLNPEWSDYPSNPDQFVDFNGKLAFTADEASHGRELWISDGTEHGTQLLSDVAPGPAASNPTELTVRGRDLFFFATDATGAQRFMKLHAGKTKPEVLANLSAPPSAQPPIFFAPCYNNSVVALGRRLYFAAADGGSGVELWSTDGAASGTHRVADINPGPASSNPCDLTAAGGHIYVSASGPTGAQLWRSDGSAAGTQQVFNLGSNSPGSFPADLTAWNGKLYFDLQDGSHGAQIWRSAGTASSTKLFVDLAPGNLNAFALPNATLRNHILFESFVPDASGLDYTISLWSSDGSKGKAVLLSNALWAGPLSMTSNALFFVREPQGIEPWITDGAPSGTRRLAEITPDSQTFMDWYVRFGAGAAFTTQEAGTPGIDVLWRTDGTREGTARVATIPVPSSGQSPSHLQQLGIGSKLFFAGSAQRYGNELWVYEHRSRHTSPADIPKPNQ